jgi:hypothetical protein
MVGEEESLLSDQSFRSSSRINCSRSDLLCNSSSNSSAEIHSASPSVERQQQQRQKQSSLLPSISKQKQPLPGQVSVPQLSPKEGILCSWMDVTPQPFPPRNLCRKPTAATSPDTAGNPAAVPTPAPSPAPEPPDGHILCSICRIHSHDWVYSRCKLCRTKN